MNDVGVQFVAPEKPCRLPGSAIVVSTHFNAMGYSLVRQNYRKFWDRLSSQGIPLLTVELAYEGQQFSLKESDATYLVQVRGGDVMWQKERLLNVAVSRLPAQYDKIVICDCDSYFDNPRWLEEVSRKLERFLMVQPYSNLIRLSQGVDWLDPAKVPIGLEDGQSYYCCAKGIEQYGEKALGNYALHGVVGIAMGFRRSLLQRHGLYDASIVGSGDTFMLYAAFNAMPYVYELCSEAFKRHFSHWAGQYFADVEKSLSYVEGNVFHFWHGSREDRNYCDRHSLTREYDFDPNMDIAIDVEGAYVWSSQKPHLHQAVRKYFADRKEDG